MPRAPVRRRFSRHGPPSKGVSKGGPKIASSSPARAELEKKLAHKPVGPRPNDSDDSDRLVVKGTTLRTRHVQRQEIYASGGVGPGDQPGAYPSRASQRKNATQLARPLKPAPPQAASSKQSLSVSTQQVSSKQNLSPPTPHVSSTTQQRPSSPPPRVPLGTLHTSIRPNGVTSALRSASAAPSTAWSLAVKPPGSGLRPTQPTPTREQSILGSLKPRRRQPSILQALDHDSSSFDLDDEEAFLPDAESTPSNFAKITAPASTPPSHPSQPSSRKRKHDADDPFRPASDTPAQRQSASPLATRRPPTSPSDMARAKGPRSVPATSHQRHANHLTEDDDIMALPESSSSPSSSPARPPPSVAPPRKKKKKPATKPVTLMSTEELQALVMPSKPRRSARERGQGRHDFGIHADADLSDRPSDVSPEMDDESTFLPHGRPPRTRARRKPPARPKAALRDRAAKAAGKPSQAKSSTNHFISASPPVLAPSMSASTRSDREAKSPSQQSTDDSSSGPLHRGNSTHRAHPDANGRPRRYGGSLRPKAGGGTDTNKENRPLDPVPADGLVPAATLPEPSPRLDRLDMVPCQDPSGGRQPSKGKWADIDAWDMDFEDVEPLTGSGSSSPLRR